jgi:hypothetical protein
MDCLRQYPDFLHLQKQINLHALYLERVPDGLLAQVGVDSQHEDRLLRQNLDFLYLQKELDLHALPLECT